MFNVLDRQEFKQLNGLKRYAQIFIEHIYFVINVGVALFSITVLQMFCKTLFCLIVLWHL